MKLLLAIALLLSNAGDINAAGRLRELTKKGKKGHGGKTYETGNSGWGYYIRE